jgi:hypothetical protein
MRRNYPTPSTLIALIALVFAMTGAAAALPGHKSVKGDDLANNSVSSKAIKKNAVASKQLKNKAVTTTKIADGAVLGSKIAAGTITADKLLDGAVTSTKIADGAVSDAKIADDAITRQKIKASSVTAPKVVDLTFDPLTLANGFAPATGFAPPSVAQDVEGEIHLRGAASQSSSAGGSLATLPTGDAPGATVFAPTVCGTTAAPISAAVTIATDGTITVTATDPADQNSCEDAGAASLDGISFPAGG